MIVEDNQSISILKTRAAEIHFLPEFNILCLHWQCPVTPAIIRDIYEQLLTHMKYFEVKQLLIDTRLRGRATPGDEVWMMQVFSPRLIKAFSENIHLAYILTPQHFAELQSESPNGSMESLSKLFCMNYFQEEEAGLAWLESKKG